jgi:hemoglobin
MRQRLTRMNPTPYELLGADAGVRALAEAFYDAMDRLPEASRIRSMHAPSLEPIKTKLADYLSGWLGGPHHYFAQHGHFCIRGAHEPFHIGPEERDQWLHCMEQALLKINASPALIEQLRGPLYRLADAMRTDQS